MAIQGLNDAWMLQRPFHNPEAITDWIKHQYRDIPYGPAELQKLDIYLPESGEGPFPTIIMIHGGGMCVCDKHDFHLYPMFYALEEGFAVAAVNYRMSPAVKYPTQLYDTKAATLFLYEHAAEYRLDGENFFLWGTSAGGNMALLGGMKKGRELPEELKTADRVPIRGVAALCAEATMTGKGGLGSGLGSFGEQLLVSLQFAGLDKKVLGTNKPDKATLDAASAFTYLPDGCAPLYIQHGDKDPGIPLAQSQRLYEEAKAVLSEEDLVLDMLKGAGHAGAGIDYFKKENVTPILDFFRRHLWKEA